MMGVGIADARSMSWWEFQAMRTVWTDRHRSPDDPVEPPSHDKVAAAFLHFNGVDLTAPASVH